MLRARSILKTVRALPKLRGCDVPQRQGWRCMSGSNAPKSQPETVLRGNDREDLSAILRVGEQFSGFEVVETKRLDAFNINAFFLKHHKSGASYLHLDSADTNNTFSIILRTPPKDSTGVAHILEHLVLCGSQKYPVRDPFFNMLKRSLNTFMNALTASDHTMYPFSTCHPRDFENLLSVYTDAVFFPKLRETDFLQEGHRIQPSTDNPLGFENAGVVFNEMKGTLSDNATLFMTRLQQRLLEGTTYGVVSGGDPPHIPELSYEQLVEFHATCYHPSSALFFSYGDLSPLSHMQQINDNCLDKFEYSEQSASQHATKYNSTKSSRQREFSERCNPDSMQGDVSSQAKFAISGLMHDSHDYVKSILMQMSSSLLISGPSAPLYQALIESGIAPTFAPGTGFDHSTRDTSFTVGVDGINVEDIGHIRTVIFDTLSKAVADPIDRERVEGILHQLELSFKHKTGNFGLGLMFGAATSWAHSADIMASIDVDERLQALKSTPDEEYTKCFRDILAALQEHATRSIELKMVPDEDLAEELEAQEQQQLATVVSNMSPEEKERVAVQSEALQREQDAQVDPSCLPSLSVSDIDPTITPVRHEMSSFTSGKAAESKIRLRKQPFDSNGVVYARLRLDARHVSAHLRPYLPLLCKVLGSVGAAEQDFREQSRQIEQTCGDISVSLSRFPSRFADSSQVHDGIVFRTYALARNFDKSLSLLKDIICSPRLHDVQRLRTLIGITAQTMSTSLTRRGHAIALSDAMASVNYFNEMSNESSGLPQVKFMQNLAKAGEEGAALASERLIELAHELLTLHAATQASPDQLIGSASLVDGVPARELDFEYARQQVLVTADERLLDPAHNSLENLLNELPLSRESVYPLRRNVAEGFVAANSSQNRYLAMSTNGIYFCAQSQATFPMHDPRTPVLHVLANILSSCYLHREVREKGGAYGASCVVRNGALGMSSFYDPNTDATLAAFDGALQWAAAGQFEDRDLDEAKLSMFADIDAPETPSSVGTGEWIRGLSVESRQEFRSKLLQCGRDDVAELAQHLVESRDQDGAVHTSILGSDLNEEFAQREGWSFENLGSHLDGDQSV